MAPTQESIADTISSEFDYTGAEGAGVRTSKPPLKKAASIANTAHALVEWGRLKELKDFITASVLTNNTSMQPMQSSQSLPSLSSSDHVPSVGEILLSIS